MTYQAEEKFQTSCSICHLGFVDFTATGVTCREAAHHENIKTYLYNFDPLNRTLIL